MMINREFSLKQCEYLVEILNSYRVSVMILKERGSGGSGLVSGLMDKYSGLGWGLKTVGVKSNSLTDVKRVVNELESELIMSSNRVL